MQPLQISIPKPCHADWETMDARACGRFCGQCSKTVIDFTQMSREKMEHFLRDRPAEKICGRFRDDQLADTLQLSVSIRPLYRKLSPLHAFAAAVLLVFGTTLFSCTTPSGQLLGEITVDGSVTSIPDSIALQRMLTGDTVVIDDPIKNTTFGRTAVIPETPAVKGELTLKPVVDSLIKTLPDITEEILIPCDFVLGGVMYDTPSVADDAIDTTTRISSTVPEPEQKVRNEVDIRIYPNPSSGIVHVDLRLLKEEPVTIDLYDVGGNRLQQLLQGNLTGPVNSLLFSLADYPAGIYFLRITSGHRIRTEKMVLEKH